MRFLSKKIKGASISKLINIYKNFVRPLIEYGYTVLGCLTKSRLKKLESFHHTSICNVMCDNNKTSYMSILTIMNMLSIKNRFCYLMCKMYVNNKISDDDYKKNSLKNFIIKKTCLSISMNNWTESKWIQRIKR